MTLGEAKHFLAERVAQQAEQNCEPLSDVQRDMLLFTEETHSPKMLELNDRFESECDSDEYEAKIARLLKQAHKEDYKNRAERRKWDDALRACKGHDFYLLVMVEAADIRRSGDSWRLLGTAILVIVVLVPTIALIESNKDAMRAFAENYLYLSSLGTIWSAFAIAGAVCCVGYIVIRLLKGISASD